MYATIFFNFFFPFPWQLGFVTTSVINELLGCIFNETGELDGGKLLRFWEVFIVQLF